MGAGGGGLGEMFDAEQPMIRVLQDLGYAWRTLHQCKSGSFSGSFFLASPHVTRKISAVG